MEPLEQLIEKAVRTAYRNLYQVFAPRHAEDEKNKSATAIDQNKQQRVLLVEDDVIIQKVHCKCLEQLGYVVDIANNGKETLDLYKPAYYAMVFLDAGLADTTGFDLAKIIRSKELPNQRQAIFMLSGFDRDDVKTKCEEAGIDDFAIKPVSFEQLRDLINKNKETKK